MTSTSKRIANLLRTIGRTEESTFLAYGFTRDEIMAAVATGTVARCGNIMGASCSFYLAAR